MTKNYQKIIEILKKGGIGVLPTDTIYGIVGLALNEKTVERIYQVRKRKPTKPLIILISSAKDLENFEIKVVENQAFQILEKTGISVIFPCVNEKFKYLHRGTEGLAFRIPSEKNQRGRILREILEKTGPLVAPSANFEGEKTAETGREAKKIFGENADFYLSNNRKLKGKPSTLIKFFNDKIEVLRGKLPKI